MESLNAARGRVTSAFGILFVVGLLSGLLLSGAIAAEPASPVAKEPALPAAVAKEPTAAELEAWRQKIMSTPQPKQGCFTAVYPDAQWRETACATPSHTPYFPRHSGGNPPQQVSGFIGGVSGPDFMATVTAHIKKAEGSFDPGSTVTSECDVPCPVVSGQIACPVNPTCGAANAVANLYSLQLNTEFFTTQVCNNAPDKSNCRGFAQFVFPSGGGGSIQYWLIDWGAPGSSCPVPQSANCALGGVWSDGWCPFPIPGQTDIDCAINAAKATMAPAVAGTSIPEVIVTATTEGFNGAASDGIAVTVNNVNNGQPFTASGANIFPDLGSQWQQAEFNVFGNGNGSQAVLGAGTNLIVRNAVDSGVSTGPGCTIATFTAESNSLTLADSPPAAATGSLPALVFSENPTAAAGANCMDATSLGDTHLTTFDGLKYDFQGSGDFLLAQDGPDFIVQTRQALAATEANWIKNATINKAVAAQIGKTRVVLSVWPPRLVIDGKVNDLAEGKTVALDGGVVVALRDGVYTILAPNRDNLRAAVNNNGINSWINVTVGLGATPHPQARGLLGNPSGNARDLKTADGRVLTAISFVDLYHSYADGWRVPANKSLFEADPAVTAGIPDKPFYASDLDAQTAERVRALCTRAGVTAPALLDDCMLDAAVLGGADDTAAKIYVRLPVPRAVLPRLVVR